MTANLATFYVQWVGKNFRQLIATIVLLIFLFFLSQQFYEIYTEIGYQKKLAHGEPTAPTHQTSKKLSSISDFSLLFGNSDRQENNQQSLEIPKTRLNLTLHGALANIQKNKSSIGSAIIQGNNQEKVYQIGEKLPGGAILSEVHANHVVIKRNGQYEKLAFPELSNHSSGLKPVLPASRSSHAQPGIGYTQPPDSQTLEERMQNLKEQLQKAGQ